MNALTTAATIAAALLAIATAAAAPPHGEYYGDKPPAQALVLPGYNAIEVRQRLAQRPLQPIEGLWHYPDEMMTVAVEQFSSPQFSGKLRYRIVLVDSEDLSLLPGTVVGYVAQSADSHKFELWLYSEQDAKRLLGPARCVATLNDDATSLTFKQNSLKVRLRFNFRQFLPRLFRFISISPYIEKEQLPVGFSKIYPHSDDNATAHNEIRYL